MRIVAAALLILVAQSTGVSAGETAKPTTKETIEQNDPVVCHTFEEIGSRLKKKRVCMHRSEWAAQRLEESQMINRTQVQRNGPGGN